MNKIDLVPQEATVLLILQQRRGKSSAQQGSQGRSYYSIRSVALEFVKTSCIAERQTLFSVGYSSHLRSPAFRLENTQPKTSQNCKHWAQFWDASALSKLNRWRLLKLIKIK